MTSALARYVPFPPDAATWAAAAPLLAAALARSADGRSLDDVHAELSTDRAQLWVAGDPVATAAITERCGKTLHMWLAASSSGAGIEALSDQVGDVAKANGIEKQRLVGRPGWSRLLKGWRLASVTMERTL